MPRGSRVCSAIPRFTTIVLRRHAKPWAVPRSNLDLDLPPFPSPVFCSSPSEPRWSSSVRVPATRDEVARVSGLASQLAPEEQDDSRTAYRIGENIEHDRRDCRSTTERANRDRNKGQANPRAHRRKWWNGHSNKRKISPAMARRRSISRCDPALALRWVREAYVKS